MRGEIEKLSWTKARSAIAKVNPAFVDIVDERSPDKRFYVYRISYPFGATITKNGLFHLPNEAGEILPINSPQTDKKYKADFAYADKGLPMGIMLKNAYELFINAHNYILPVIVTKPGSILALWKKLDTKPTYHPMNIFSATAGARNLFMLPHVGDFMNHKNLKRDFNVSQQAPRDLTDHWEIFKSIAQHQKSDWRAELLLFPQIWLDKINQDPAWEPLHNFLVECAWESSAYERNQVFYDFALSCTQANNNLKPNPYLLDTVKHLLSVSLGAAPGFKVATDELLGPIDLLQEAYAESYGLKKYAPTMLHPAHIDLGSKANQSVYYSLQLPTTISFSPRSRKMTNTLFDLREIKYIMNTFLEDVVTENSSLKHTIFERLPELIEYQFYHNKRDPMGEILPTRKMVEHDAALRKGEKAQSNPFAENGPFVRGCIGIGKKADD